MRSKIVVWFILTSPFSTVLTPVLETVGQNEE